MLRKVTISKFKYKNFALLNKKMFFYSRNKNVILNLEFSNIFFDSEFIQNHEVFFTEKVKTQNLIELKGNFRLSKTNYSNKWKSEIRFKNKLNIVIKSNNIFCTFSEISNSKNKNIQSASTGMYKIKTTKKRVKYTYLKMISLFIRKIYYKLKNFNEEGGDEDYNPFDFTILNIVAKKKLHKSIVRIFDIYRVNKRNLLQKNVNEPFLFINIEPKKCFNGCRVSKKRRKKRLKNVVFS
jgi:hypothetical protein